MRIRRRIQVVGERLSQFELGGTGQKLICVARRVRHPRVTLDTSDASMQFQDISMWELLVYMERQGWVHQVARSSDVLEGYAPGRLKIWYSRPKADSFSRSCLVALAQDAQEVPHFRKPSEYDCLLAGGSIDDPRPPRRPRAMLEHVDEEDLEALGRMFAIQNRRQLRRRATKPGDVSQAPAALEGWASGGC